MHADLLHCSVRVLSQIAQICVWVAQQQTRNTKLQNGNNAALDVRNKTGRTFLLPFLLYSGLLNPGQIINNSCLLTDVLIVKAN